MSTLLSARSVKPTDFKNVAKFTYSPQLHACKCTYKWRRVHMLHHRHCNQTQIPLIVYYAHHYHNLTKTRAVLLLYNSAHSPYRPETPGGFTRIPRRSASRTTMTGLLLETRVARAVGDRRSHGTGAAAPAPSSGQASAAAGTGSYRRPARGSSPRSGRRALTCGQPA